jgi:hypothetical protein
VDIGGKVSVYKVQSTALTTTMFKSHIAEIETFLTEAMGIVGSQMVSTFSKPDTEIKVESKSGFKPTVDTTVPEAYQLAVNAMMQHAPVPPKMLNVMDPIPLIDAKGLYRPVKGTSPNTRYFLAAVFPTFKLAVKLKGNNLSVRVEGNIGNDMKPMLSHLGITPGINYWSSHAPVDSTETAQQYYAAIVATLGGSLLPLANLKLIEGKG